MSDLMTRITEVRQIAYLNAVADEIIEWGEELLIEITYNYEEDTFSYTVKPLKEGGGEENGR